MTISEITNKNFEALTTKKMTAVEMALTPHNLSNGAKFARRLDDKSLWIWSDTDNCWKQIDRE